MKKLNQIVGLVSTYLKLIFKSLDCYIIPSWKNIVWYETYIVTAQKQPQSQQLNNQNCSGVGTKYGWEAPPISTTTTHHHHHTNSNLHDRAEIEQYSENKTY